MKEIDKIRIRQWNQDNPYIQMKIPIIGRQELNEYRKKSCARR